MALINCSAMSRAVSSDVLGNNTANSSPPKRPYTSAWRNEALITRQSGAAPGLTGLVTVGVVDFVEIQRTFIHNLRDSQSRFPRATSQGHRPEQRSSRFTRSNAIKKDHLT